MIPQAAVTAVTAGQWRVGNAGPGKRSRVVDALGIFDIFGAGRFMTIVVLLFVRLDRVPHPAPTARLHNIRAGNLRVLATSGSQRSGRAE